MKSVFNTLLVLVVVLLGYMCVRSILNPIEFEEAKKLRDKQVQTRLIEIRKAQIEYRNLFGAYTDNFDTLVDFVRNGKIPFVKKEGELTDDQLEAGLTEEKAIAIVKRGKKSEIEKNGLQNFSRDTFFVSAIDTLFGADYAVDSLPFVPNTNGAKFEMEIGELTTASGFVIKLFEARTPFKVYLKGLDRQEIINLKDKAEKLERYPGLKVGSVTEANNNAGNWE